MMDRRNFLAAAPALIATPAAALCSLQDGRTPSRAELERYYAFLWCEFQRLAEEMGVEMHDAMIVHRAGGLAAVLAMAPLPPSTRARHVLALSGWGAP